jgi:hypothetical protein
MTDHPHSEPLGHYFDLTQHARRAGVDQAVAAVREKIHRLMPQLDRDGPEVSRRRLALIFQTMPPEVDRVAFATVLAD